MKIKVESGDITTKKGDSLITAINSSGMWFGGIDGAIRRSKGNYFHQALAEKSNVNGLPDGKPFFIHGTSERPALPHKSFENVIFVIDDLKKKLHEIILSGLQKAEDMEQETVLLPTVRMGVMLGVVEKSEDEALDEMKKGVELFEKTNPFHVKEVTFVVYGNPELQKKLEERFQL
jgi:O-acetyl-ADP-ribose deacetylase (regulator of RNase III)